VANFVEDLYEPLLAEGGSVAAQETSRKWHDLGTPERYRRAVLDWGRRRGWVASGATVASSATLRGSVVEAPAAIHENSKISASVVLPGARIGPGCRVFESIIGPEVDVPPNTTVQRRLVTAVRADAPGSRDASIVGGLVYEPI
jgi:NDP-sugar pyrophosphorylase family protein